MGKEPKMHVEAQFLVQCKHLKRFIEQVKSSCQACAEKQIRSKAPEQLPS